MNTQDILNRLEGLLEDYKNRSKPLPYSDPMDHAYGMCEAFGCAADDISELIREFKESL